MQKFSYHRAHLCLQPCHTRKYFIATFHGTCMVFVVMIVHSLCFLGYKKPWEMPIFTSSHLKQAVWELECRTCVRRSVESITAAQELRVPELPQVKIWSNQRRKRKLILIFQTMFAAGFAGGTRCFCAHYQPPETPIHLTFSPSQQLQSIHHWCFHTLLRLGSRIWWVWSNLRKPKFKDGGALFFHNWHALGGPGFYIRNCCSLHILASSHWTPMNC